MHFFVSASMSNLVRLTLDLRDAVVDPDFVVMVDEADTGVFPGDFPVVLWVLEGVPCVAWPFLLEKEFSVDTDFLEAGDDIIFLVDDDCFDPVDVTYWLSPGVLNKKKKQDLIFFLYTLFFVWCRGFWPCWYYVIYEAKAPSSE